MRSRAFVLALTLALGVALGLFGDARPGRAEPLRPHVVILLADDLGWRDVGHHGSEIPTPNIDRLARQGVELDRFYVQPTCSPTRAGLMTGKSPRRLGIVRPLGKNDRGGLPLEETLLPEHLRRIGYQTLMVGKWHLGNHTPDYFPQSRGFEHFYGFLSGGIGYWDHVHGGGLDWQRNGQTLREAGYATRLLADEAVRLLRERDRSRPTFLYLAFNAPHLPNEAPPETVARHASIGDARRRVHAAMVEELDRAIGRVVDTLEAEGMRQDTILLFASDNGGLSPGSAPAPFALVARISARLFDRPHPIQALEFIASNVEDGASDNRPLRGGKTRATEGGVRVPASIGWPGRLVPRRYDGFVTISDVLPTLLEAVGAGARIPDELDGASQWKALSGAGPAEVRDYVVTGFEETALYRPPWKLVTSDPPRLYDVYADPLEERDLASAEPGRVVAMQAAVDAWPLRERGEASSLLELVLDPDRFGGPEDRPPWADVAQERAAARGAGD